MVTNEAIFCKIHKNICGWKEYLGNVCLFYPSVVQERLPTVSAVAVKDDTLREQQRLDNSHNVKCFRARCSLKNYAEATTSKFYLQEKNTGFLKHDLFAPLHVA